MLLGRVARLGIAMMLVVGVLGAFAPKAAAEAISVRTVWVEDSGHTLDGLFLDAWAANQQLFGLPISEELEVRVSLDGERPKKRVIQYFENLVLVYVPDDPRGAEWRVQVLDIGRDALAVDSSQPRALTAGGPVTCGNYTASHCRIFKETGHTVRGSALMNWWAESGGDRFIGAPISEQYSDTDGFTTQYFEKVVLRWKTTEDIGLRQIGREIARRENVDTRPIAKPNDVPKWSESLRCGAIGCGPGPLQGGFKEIVVDISLQSLWAYEGGVLVLSTLVSTGTGDPPETETPRGYYQIHTKLDSQTMTGNIGGEKYRVEDVPFVMYFDWGGNALHGAYWHNNFGYRMSHGCVNLPMDVAEWMYGWADIGTYVSLID